MNFELINNRIYINDFVEDLNYQKAILFIGNVNCSKLFEKLKHDNLNHLYRFDCIVSDSNPNRNKRYILNDIDATRELYERTRMTIKNVIFNDPATIIFWMDGTKTVVKCGEGDVFDPEKGLAMAIAKKALGNCGNYYNEFKKWLPKEDEESLYPKTLLDTINEIKENMQKKLALGFNPFNICDAEEES